MKTLLLLIVAGALILTTSGCATTRHGSDVSGRCRETTLAGHDLGRLAILARMVRDGGIPNAAEKEDAAARAAAAALTAQGTATLVAADSLVTGLALPWPDAGDAELAAAARASGIDTVAVLTITEYTGKLHLGLPALWGTETSYRYELRLLDVKTGHLLLDARRFGQRGGPFLVRGLDDLHADFQNDLNELVRGKQAS